MPDDIQGVTVPEFARWINPVLKALKELGGSGTPREVVERVASNERLSEDILDSVNPAGGLRFPNQVHWARYFLAETGFIDRSRRGVWKLTDRGAAIDGLSPVAVRELVSEVHAQPRSAANEGITQAREFDPNVGAPAVDSRESSELMISADGRPPETEFSDYRSRLAHILQALSPSGFERLCQRLLREAGFEQVMVTGKSGDGGIDGHGILALNAFVSFRVLFQCKRYVGSVSPAQVRDFRGAMQGRADKGLILTTGSFTSEARRESARDGAPPIELVDGEKLVDLFAKLELGLKPVTTYEVDEDFFTEYRL